MYISLHHYAQFFFIFLLVFSKREHDPTLFTTMNISLYMFFAAQQKGTCVTYFKMMDLLFVELSTYALSTSITAFSPSHPPSLFPLSLSLPIMLMIQ